MEFIIRNEEPGDIEQVRAVVQSAFPSDAESKLVDVLRANGKAIISLVAVRDGAVFGHILFSPVSITPPPGVTPSRRDTPPGNAKGIGLAPVAVRPDAQSQGIGSQLIREGLQRCRDLGYDYCVVLGGPRYYQRFGFEQASPFNIQNEYGVDEEFMWIRFTDCRIEGLVRYAAEFAELSV